MRPDMAGTHPVGCHACAVAPTEIKEIAVMHLHLALHPATFCADHADVT
jgi:hypothetical protein